MVIIVAGVDMAASHSCISIPGLMEKEGIYPDNHGQ